MSAWMSVAALAICGTVAVGVGVVGDAAHDAAKARSAADAAALAGAASGQAVAEEVAEMNGAQLISYRAEGPVIRVVVIVDRSRQQAAAERFTVSVP